MAPRKDKTPKTRNTLDLQYIAIAQIVPYALNARDNEIAVPAVMQSITEFGFRIPIILDTEMVIIAGHTRVEAAKRLGMTDVPAFIASDLTPDQVKAFRLVDNKTAELATWDFDLLAGEVAGLVEVGIDLTPYGWSSEELDCLREVVGEDALDHVPMDNLNDGVNSPKLSSGIGQTHITADAKSVRISVGEFNFFIGVAEYREWAEKLRKRNGYAKDAIVLDLATRLEMVEEMQGHDRKSVAKNAKDSGEGAANRKVTVETQRIRARAPKAAPAAEQVISTSAPRTRVRARA